MGRRKIEIKAIKDDRNRSVTFLKRKGGLFKKAHELSVLCSVDVAVIIFGHNKKLYEFSSGDIHETLGRYQYYGQPHEHKGPADFAGKGDDDDDNEDDISPPPDDGMPQMVPPHIQHQPGFQYINQAPSASPPITNGVPFHHRHGTPQPQAVSRPDSRNNVRRMSSNLSHATPPPQNGYAYVPNPSIYNPQANPNMPPQQPHHPRSGQYQQFGHPPQHQPPPPHQAIPQHLPHRPQHTPPLPQQAHHHTPPLQQQPPPHHQQTPQVQQAYMQDQRAQSVHQTFPQREQTIPPSRSPPQQHQQQPTKQEGNESTPSPPKRLSTSKSRSIFTPIDDRGSVLAHHFGFGPPSSDSPKGEGQVKSDTMQEKSTTGPASGPLPLARSLTHPQQPKPAPPETLPPPRANSTSVAGKRPQLKVQIPSENSDGGSATADSSPRGSATNTAATPARGSSEAGPTGVVLPPPSPSASALLSAGAQGPGNPFARPPPPAATSQNTNAYQNNNNMDTPISALPSRFADALLPSPSSFFPEWGFGRAGPDTNMLPSPLNFPTPVMQTGPGFSREDEGDKKRKSSDGGSNPTEPSGSGKRVKT